MLPTELRLDLKRVAYNEFLDVMLLINTLLTPLVADTEAPWPPMQTELRNVMLLPLFTSAVSLIILGKSTTGLTCNAVVAIEDPRVLDEDVIPTDIVPVGVEREDTRGVEVVGRVNLVTVDMVVVACDGQVPSDGLAELQPPHHRVVGRDTPAVRAVRLRGE
jgi:hypothetical protein